MKVATFNINNVRRRLPNLLDWMRESSPDVVCLQELKATDTEFPVAAIRDAGTRQFGKVRRRGMGWPFSREPSPSRPCGSCQETQAYADYDARTKRIIPRVFR